MILTQKIGRSLFYYVILTTKLCNGLKQPDMPQYDPTIRDPYLYMQDFERKLVLYKEGVLLYKLFPRNLTR